MFSHLVFEDAVAALERLLTLLVHRDHVTLQVVLPVRHVLAVLAAVQLLLSAHPAGKPGAGRARVPGRAAPAAPPHPRRGPGAPHGGALVPGGTSAAAAGGVAKARAMDESETKNANYGTSLRVCTPFDSPL